MKDIWEDFNPPELGTFRVFGSSIYNSSSTNNTNYTDYTDYMGIDHYNIYNDINPHLISEINLWPLYNEQDSINIYVNHVLNTLANDIIANFDILNADDKIKEFDRVNNIHEKLFYLVRNMIKFGIGIAELEWDNDINNVKYINVLDNMHIRDIKTDENGNIILNYQDNEYTINMRDDDMKFIVLQNYDNNNNKIFSQSMLRSSIDILQAIYINTKDMPKMLKQISTPIKVIYADVESLPKNEAEDRLDKITNDMKGFDSANCSSIAMDSRNEMKVVGSGGGHGTVINPMTFLQPLIQVIIAKFMIASGTLIPESSNKATIKRQELQAEQQLQLIRRHFKYTIKNKLFSKITDADIKIKFNLQHDFDMEQADKYATLYSAGILTREEAQELLGLNPNKFKSQTYTNSENKIYMKKSDTNFTTSREEKVDSDSVRM